MTFTITPLRVPHSVNAELREHARILTSSYARDAGIPLLEWTAEGLLALLHNTTYSTVRAFTAHDGERIVGAASLSFDNSTSHEAELVVATDPDYGDPSLADALYEALEREAAALGRDRLIDYVATRGDASTLDEADLLRPTSGIGCVPRHDPRARFMLDRGYSLGLVERASVFARPEDPSRIQRILDDALAFAGDDYAPVWWSGRTPDEYVDAYAYAVSRMSTDVPSGDIDVEEQTWDADRIRTRDERHERVGHLFCVAAVVHRPTGTMVAFNELVVGSDRAKPTENGGTLVLEEHRGHRLGTVVKALGLVRWLDVAPDSPSVFTFNAEENRPMLDVNEAVGFTPAFWEGTWSKQL
ncbi:hypothetical protein GCM10010922_20910 [Microbacterium sorbitolivorans]|uniref:N-acetyltransferase n=1 Tax=Microbacterium sorbitolivorans TaxID=1867410 RepID=A0A367Y7N6_9MICO|nr:GNAT family N-acetyltransferase [Microbacterium sorbitolivorans]RCK61865.1 N-acetyltransferase [Microbacterium sorbitolivorans]GGF45032.1 hypothetical protein GCM10010922_20910 [Microbacterium sorbitolivorans]